jgi:pimeloyl-ACP methyl ester carboxylesterase
MDGRLIFSVCLTLWISLSGCFGRFVMTKKELKEYYKDKEKPTYFTIQNDSVSLFCATAGNDTLPPLLLIHGAPGAWYGSRSFLDDSILKANFHIIAMDRLGYNRSRFKNKKKAVTSIQTQSIAIHEAMRLNRSRKTGVVVGSSYGAPIAANIAILYPQEFHHVVMLAPAIDPDHEKFWWFHKFIKHGPIKWMLPRYFKTTTNEKFTHVKELKLMLPKWQQLTVPITVVQGGADEIVDPINLDFAKAQLSDKRAEFIFLPEAGHLIRWQHPELVKKILLQSIPEIRTLNLSTAQTP